MAKNNKAIARANRNIQNIAKGISGSMDSLYRATYMSSPQQGNDLQDLNDRINSSLDKIVDRNMNVHGMPSVSRLYSRIIDSNKGKDSDIIDSLDKMFDNGLMTDDLYGMFMSNRYLKELDNEIDTVCKYMPKLEEALAVQKDCVLSADHFSKDFLSFENPNSSSDEDNALFNERAKDLKEKYELARLVEEIYEDTSKYGEKFIYRVPYSEAIGKLLAVKPDGSLVAPVATGKINESAEDDSNDMESYMFSMNSNSSMFTGSDNQASFKENAVIMESTLEGDNKNSSKPAVSFRSVLKDKESFRIGVELCKGGYIESAIRDHQTAFKKKTTFSAKSLASIHEAVREKHIQASGNIELGTSKRDERIIANDGLIGGETPEPVKVKAPGCVIRKLPREQVVPIYIDDICMGYYFFELRTTDTSESFLGFKNILGDPLTNMRGDSHQVFNTVDNQRQDDTIRYVAGQLSTFIDKNFVNNNQDLAKEIYMILKYNDLFNTPSIDTIRVTFVPPEDMVHFFFKQDPITHRGISDLEKGLIPAKIYSSLYITTSIGNLTRGQDKRVYYVKQNVETNIAQTLLNTIAQIKQSNFGIRQFQNINNILNITGRFNDFVIPTNSSGDPPVQFEIMPGQEIQTPTDLMESLEEMAVNSTGIPIEIIQARQSIDYAMQLTMSSSKVLRFCYKRQELFQALLNQLITPIYNYEYDEAVTINVILPPPSFINITNTNQLVDNTKTFVQSIVDADLANEDDDKLKNIYFNKLFKHYLGTHLDVATHDAILDRARIEAKANSDESHSDGGESDY